MCTVLVVQVMPVVVNATIAEFRDRRKIQDIEGTTATIKPSVIAGLEPQAFVTSDRPRGNFGGGR
jgi:SH3-like domain-containing protein